MKSLLVLLGLLGLSHCGIFTRSKCVTVPSNLCAVVYDDEKCNGWALNINEGEVGDICIFSPKKSSTTLRPRSCSSGGTLSTTGTGMTSSPCP